MNQMQAEYDSLPESIKSSYSFDEYKNMGDFGREKLIEYETEPEYTE